MIDCLRGGRVGERATRVARPTLPSSNRRCRFPTSGSPENSRLRHAQVPTDGSAPTAPDAATKFLLAEAGTAAGYVVANDGSDGLEHGLDLAVGADGIPEGKVVLPTFQVPIQLSNQDWH